jgi:hypothetical protein
VKQPGKRQLCRRNSQLFGNLYQTSKAFFIGLKVFALIAGVIVSEIICRQISDGAG